MINNDLFKQLQFTKGKSSTVSPWFAKLNAIKQYTQDTTFNPKPDLLLPTTGEHGLLRFKLVFHSTLYEQQSISTTTCSLHIYEQLFDGTLHRLSSEEELNQRSLTTQDKAWLSLFHPYMTNDEFSVLLPASWEAPVLKALCAQSTLFFIDEEPLYYTWHERDHPLLFVPELQKEEDEWKLWGKMGHTEEHCIDLWDIQAVTAGGIVRQQQHLFAYEQHAYPWVETLLASGSIRCPYHELNLFLYELLCFFEPDLIQWPSTMQVETITIPLQPMLYVKTKQDKKNAKTNIEAFIWFRAEKIEFPREKQPKVLDTQVGRQRITIRKLDRDAAHQYEQDISMIEGCVWDDRRHAFTLALAHTTNIFYALLHRHWEIWAENLQIKLFNDLNIQLNTEQQWFEMEITTGDPRQRIPVWQLIHFLKKQRLFIQLDDGSLGILPESWYQTFEQLIGLRIPDTADKEDYSLRFSTAHAFQFAQLAEMMTSADNVNFKGDEAFESIRHVLLNINGLTPMKPAPTFRFTLRHYQEVGLSWMHFLGRTHLGGCLADDMGLGKTVQLLAYLDLKRYEGEGNCTSLLVCPRSLTEHWHEEARLCAPKLKVFILTAADIPRLTVLTKHYDLLLISYGLVRIHVELLRQHAFNILVLDEAQIIKNSASQVSMAINQLNGQQRLALSGTPIENHLGEFFSLFQFLNPGLTTTNTLLKSLRPLILRRLKSDVATELPPKLEQVVTLPMEERQATLYASLKDYYQAQIKKQNKEKFYDNTVFLEGLLRLRQVACHPWLLKHPEQEQEENAEDYSNKFEFLKEKLKGLISANHKAIVFSQFTSLLKLFCSVLDNYDIAYEYLDGQSQHRMEIVTRFQENEHIPILLAGIKSAGLGLNLTAADYCFILDPWWNPAVEQQAVDRIHRIGQQKTVNIYRLVSQHTVEEKMLLLKEEKQKVADQLMTADHTFLEHLSYDDFQFLFQ